jgi:hypothetical protein
VSKMLPVGAVVDVTEPPIARTTSDSWPGQPQPDEPPRRRYRAQVVGYDLHRYKYRLARQIVGGGFSASAIDWAFPGWCTPVHAAPAALRAAAADRLEELLGASRERSEELADAVLDAAFAVCTVVTESRPRWPGDGFATPFTAGHLGSFQEGAVIDRRTVITTPIETEEPA